MNKFAAEAGTRVLALAALLCLFTVFYVIGCVAVVRVAVMGDYVG